MLSLLCEKGIIQNLYMDLPAYYEIYHDQFDHSVIFSDFLEKNSSHGSQGVCGTTYDPKNNLCCYQSCEGSERKFTRSGTSADLEKYLLHGNAGTGGVGRSEFRKYL
jgi:hypothetical protein